MLQSMESQRVGHEELNCQVEYEHLEALKNPSSILRSPTWNSTASTALLWVEYEPLVYSSGLMC